MATLEDLATIIGTEALDKIKLTFPGAVFKIPLVRNNSHSQKIEIEPMDFPCGLDPIVSLIGVNAALKLVEQFKSSFLYIPNHLKSDHKIVKAIGWDLAFCLSQELGGDCFLVQRCDGVNRKIRDRKILDSIAQGRRISDVARDFNLHNSTIHNIINRYDDYTTPSITGQPEVNP